jgi:predicted amidophosphoribosyltransferase
MAAEIAARIPEGLTSATLVPVPAHPRRRRKEGFNQAAALARALGSRTGLPVRELLVRAGAVAPQVGLERGARLINARGSVRARRVATPPERAVVVDDVYTTGATLDACAAAVRAAGVADVSAVTFARAVLA